MKILQVCAYTAPYEGNFVKSLRALEEKTKQFGYDTIYAFPISVKEYEWCNLLEVNHKVYYLPVAHARISPTVYNIFRQIYKENKDIEILHSHFELYDVPASLMAPNVIKVFWHLHDCIGDLLNGLSKYIWKIQYSVFSKRAILLAASDIHRRAVVGLGFKNTNTYYLPNSIDTTRIKQVQNDRNTTTDLLMFGKLYYIKGVDLAVQAVKNIGNKLSLCVVGGCEGIQCATDSYTITTIPQTPDINLVYGSTKCFLHISRTEGMSYALLEALYTGLPVVVSNIPENMIAQEFPTAHIIPSENVGALEAIIKELIANDFKESDNNIKISRKLIEEKYSLESWVRRMLVAYFNISLQ